MDLSRRYFYGRSDAGQVSKQENANYFINTECYNNIKEEMVVIVLGKKGTGKTHIAKKLYYESDSNYKILIREDKDIFNMFSEFLKAEIDEIMMNIKNVMKKLEYLDPDTSNESKQNED